MLQDTEDKRKEKRRQKVKGEVIIAHLCITILCVVVQA